MEVVWDSDGVEYGQRLHQLEKACVDYSGFINYVKDTWLTPHRQRFVGAWINRVLHLGNTTTNRYVLYFLLCICFICDIFNIFNMLFLGFNLLIGS